MIVSSNTILYSSTWRGHIQEIPQELGELDQQLVPDQSTLKGSVFLQLNHNRAGRKGVAYEREPEEWLGKPLP